MTDIHLKWTVSQLFILLIIPSDVKIVKAETYAIVELLRKSKSEAVQICGAPGYGASQPCKMRVITTFLHRWAFFACHKLIVVEDVRPNSLLHIAVCEGADRGKTGKQGDDRIHPNLASYIDLTFIANGSLGVT